MLQVLDRCVRLLARPGAALLVALSLPVAAGPLKSVEVTASGADTSVGITFTGLDGPPTAFALDAPRRIVVDLPGIAAGSVSFSGAGSVAKVRAAQFDGDTTRVVLDLAAPARITASAAAGRQLTLRIAPIGADEFAKLVASGRSKLEMPTVVAAPPPKAAPTPKPVPAIVKAEPPATKAPPVKLAAAPAATAPTTRQVRPTAARQRARGGLPVVVIDAGHGGKDVGTISVLGPGKYEKDVVLAIATAIKKDLDASGRVRAVLTRGDDTYLRHRDRFELARRNRAELFISVHADSAPVPAASGATVYTLSETASDAEAARLAAKENRSDIIAGVDLGFETSEVSDILIDLAQRETMNTSAQFAAILQRELRQDIKVRSQFHRFAGFLVLKAPDVPSVLLETGYLSNETDSKFLFSPAGQAQIAKGVRRAVEAHFLRRLAQR